MNCEAARRALVIARRGRDDAKVRELQELHDARNVAEHIPRCSYSSVLLEQAQADVELWESRLINAEKALAECLEKREMIQQHPPFKGSVIRTGGANV